MKALVTPVAAVILVSIVGACHKDDGKDNPPTQQPNVRPAPVVALGLNGSLAAGSMAWTLPDFLKGQFKELGKVNAEAALTLDLTNGTEKRASGVNTGFSVKPCNPADEVETFLSTVAKPAAENVPVSHRTNVDEVTSWTAESKSFKGRLFLKKLYKSEGETGFYRIDALVTNINTSECVLWNFVFTPAADTTAAFVERSDEYKALMESLSSTWEDLGADFEE